MFTYPDVKKKKQTCSQTERTLIPNSRFDFCNANYTLLYFIRVASVPSWNRILTFKSQVLNIFIISKQIDFNCLKASLLKSKQYNYEQCPVTRLLKLEDMSYRHTSYNPLTIPH